MAGETFQRNREGQRFVFRGMKLNASPDALPPGKYAFAQNIRALLDDAVQTRPGQVLKFTTAGAKPITDLRAYASLGSDGLPRVLVRDNADGIYLDNGALVGTLAGGGASPGASMIPFRPNQSPNPYMYVANGSDYQKFSAPDTNNAVVANKAGIAEPQPPCEAAQIAQMFTEVLSPGGNWNTGGTASAWVSGNRSTDIVITALNDPVSPFQEGGIHGAVPPRWSVQVSQTQQYQRGEVVYFTGTPQIIAIVEQVIPPLAISMTVQAIFYFAGPPGRAVITLQGITAPSKQKAQHTESGVILNNQDVIAQLVRGALVRIGTETTYVLSVTSGPDNQICIECFLNNNHVIGESVIGLPTIIINGVTNASALAPGTPIIGDMGNVETFNVTVGIGTLTTGAAGAGPTGMVIARPTTSLNGWGPNAHVGAYELGVNQGFNWGLNNATTNGYSNPNLAFDGDVTTKAIASGQHTHQYYGCVWGFVSGTPQSNMVLNILSEVPANGEDGLTITLRSAGIWYSLDNSATWQQVYNQGPRTKRWDSIPLPAGQDLTKIQVMAFTDSHDDMAHYVFEINITTGAASIGIGTASYQPDDYLHFSVLLDNPANLTELKLQLDVSDATFLTNYYYYSVRPSDLVPTTSNTLTQLGAIQDILQQTEVQELGQESGLPISSPTVAGTSQWTEIWIPIRALVRIGGDQTKTLATITGVQILVNALGTLNVSISSICFVGGGNPNVGDIGEPYRYRVRPRSSATGTIGNPSPDMRYGVPAVRQPVQINLPSPSYDPQIDTWDVFRFGGSVPSWRFIGSTPSTATFFQDNYDDDAANAGDALDFDNFEPWPSVDVPFSATATVIVGTEALVAINSPTNALRFLPGNLVNLGGQAVFTLRKRPVLFSGTSYLFEFVECTAGFAQGSNGQVTIYEPEIARQFLPYMWGPDVSGTVFACGDPLRAGTLYFSKNSAPDSAPDSYNLELTQPSEPLLGGEVQDGLAFVWSAERLWALYPQPDNPAQRYNPVQVPVDRGIAAPFGHCTDGKQLFSWAKDGIRSSTKGSLTDEDLYNLFPHEGVKGVAVSYGTPPLGHTINPPDYSRAGTFRLAYANYYLYAIYQDASGLYNCLTYDTRRDGWCVDVFTVQVSAIYHPEQQAGTLLSNSARYDEVLLADATGRVTTQTDLANDVAAPIFCSVSVNEFDGGDSRAPKQWGDFFVDSNPSSQAGLIVQPMSLGVPASVPTTIPTSASRVRRPVSVGGIVTSDFLGLLLAWTDDFTAQTAPTILREWQPSYVIQPATTIEWQTLGSAFGMKGYGHIRQIAAAWVSTEAVTLTIIPFDGQPPAPIIIPSSGGAYKKALFPLTANKGQLFSFHAVSTQPFQFFLDDFDIYVGAWGRDSAYSLEKVVDGPPVDSAPL